LTKSIGKKAQKTPVINPQATVGIFEKADECQPYSRVGGCYNSRRSGVFSRAYGNAGAGQLLIPQTQMYICSLTRSITAMAVMQLVEQRLIEDFLRFLPETHLILKDGNHENN
jgi:CubicO group peptidase (beta-lactamase class C family)